MTVSVRDLLDQGLSLRAVAGEAGLDREIRTTHTSELQDPTPWLKGGELLLTTGMDLKSSPALQRTYIGRLIDADLAGLGFGIGFGFDSVPRSIITAAEKAGFPVLEVPYPVPFIAIAEAVASRLAEERVKEAQSSIEVHERLTSLVGDGAGPADLLDAMSSLSGAWVLLFDRRGEVRVRAERAGDVIDAPGIWQQVGTRFHESGAPQAASDSGPTGSWIALPITVGGKSEGVLVLGRDQRLSSLDRLVLRHGSTVLSLLLQARRAVVQAERRVAGDLLCEGFSGRLAGLELDRRLPLVGFPATENVTALVVETDLDADPLEALSWEVDAALGGRARRARTTIVGRRIAALVADDDPGALAKMLLAEFGGGEGSFRVGIGEEGRPSAMRHSYLGAVFALRAAPASTTLAAPKDLGSYGFLLGSQPRPVLEGYVRSVLGKLIERDAERSSDLVRSVRAYVAFGGRWEPGAEALGIHRHTLRYRVHQAEELLGRDLSSPEDQLEIWLALKAAEILDE
jgi:purine catabolism regulator